jgi:hypothetical protein
MFAQQSQEAARFARASRDLREHEVFNRRVGSVLSPTELRNNPETVSLDPHARAPSSVH